jgi:hypothetical protein
MTFESIPSLVTSDYELTCGDGGLIRLSGQLAMHDPSAVIGGFFERVHQALVAERVREVVVDIRALRFVNSSSIRVFVDWLSRIDALPAEARYQVVFVSDTSLSWQRSTLHVLASMFRGLIRIDDRREGSGSAGEPDG